MVKDDAMKANSKLRQNCLDVLAVETRPNDTQLTVRILHHFITRLPIRNINKPITTTLTLVNSLMAKTILESQYQKDELYWILIKSEMIGRQ